MLTDVGMSHIRDTQPAAHGPDPTAERVISDPLSKLKNIRNYSRMQSTF